MSGKLLLNGFKNLKLRALIGISLYCSENLLADIIDGNGSLEKPKQSFYVAVQLTMGAVKVYEWQIDSLYENAHQAAIVTHSYQMAEIEM